MTNPFSRILWHALQGPASVWGVRLTAVLGGPIDHPRDAIPARRIYDLLDERNFDGVLLHTAALSYYSDQVSLRRFLAEIAPLPVVSLGIPLDGVSSVALRQDEAVRKLVHHLYEVHGHRKFAFVCGPLDQIEARLRHNAFRETLESLGVPAENIETFPGDYDRESGAAAVSALADRLGPALALVCTNDQEALGAIEEAKARGIGVPWPLTVTGFDDIDLSPLQEPSLTTIGQPFVRHAARALQLLVDQIRGTAGVVHDIEDAPVLFRESCGCQSSSEPPPTDRVDLIRMVLAGQANATESYRAFAAGWIPDYLTAFEHLLETGNATVLKRLWTRYHEQTLAEQVRGLSFRLLFAGLVTLFGARPSFQRAMQENLILAGAAESRKGARQEQTTRNFFFRLHGVEVVLGQVNDRAGLAAFRLSHLQGLGISGLAVVRFGAPPALLYLRAPWAPEADPTTWGPIDYPAFLPPSVEALEQPPSRLTVALFAEGSYLGYAVFWSEGPETFVCDFLANQLSGALQRIELFERIREQSRSLEASLEETKRMQEQLVETEKVASLGRLVAGVAHEINTPLGTGITGTSFLLERLGEVRSQLREGTLAKSGLENFLHQGQEALDGVLRNLMKAGELIQAFKGLGLDLGQGEWKPIRLSTLFGDLRAVYDAEFAKRGIGFLSEIPNDHRMIYSLPSALVQVAGELLENAMDHAFPPEFAGKAQVLLQVEVRGEVLRLAVTDNGRGLAADERRHIFDPLYTTRRPEGHAGLGLHLAFQLITRTLKGQMTVASEVGSGSCFLCLIPLRMS